MVFKDTSMSFQIVYKFKVRKDHKTTTREVPQTTDSTVNEDNNNKTSSKSNNETHVDTIN